ncbi:SDR family NAD(P)-dependent oxidoreductase [Bradyrhizobium mercantei]|uniref:SDR family NAD(P)-dependent oxidoreductase n=1 Tax=Bradyrhizobium mercantei TaxID=1904807 RepID=UPI000B5B0BCA|nr:SDR family NAD(P)-dependent oxidoreductase [Bradyrhizobium mercantei]
MMSASHFPLNGRVAIVTGGSRGIGLAISDALKRCDVRVVNWDRDPLDDATIAVDITDQASIAAALAITLDRHRRLDILVNNAGYAGLTLPTVDYPIEEWRRILEVNLTGTFLVCQAVAPALVANGWGRIVNIASLAGKEGTPNAAAYSSSKAGVLALTKSLGKELATTGVLVNAIAPAAVHTTLLDQMSADHVQVMINKSPMGRLGEPDEVAELALFLCSESCTFNTGAVFDLSGGRATY